MDLQEKLKRTITPYKEYLPYFAVLYTIFLVILIILFILSGAPLFGEQSIYRNDVPPIFFLVTAAIVPLLLVYLLVLRLPKINEEYQLYAKLFIYGLVVYIGYLLVLFYQFLSSQAYEMTIFESSLFTYLIAAAIPLILPYYLLWNKFVTKDRAYPLSPELSPSDMRPTETLHSVQSPSHTPYWRIINDRMRFSLIIFSILCLVFGLGLIFYTHLAELSRPPWSESWEISFMFIFTFLPGFFGLILSLIISFATVIFSIRNFRIKRPFKRLSKRVYIFGSTFGFIFLVFGLTLPIATDIQINDIKRSYEQIITENPQSQSEIFFLGIKDIQKLGRHNFRYQTTYMILLSGLSSKNFELRFKFIDISSEKELVEPLRSVYYYRGDTIYQEDIKDSTEVITTGTYYNIITSLRVFFSQGDPDSVVTCDIGCWVYNEDSSNDSLTIFFVEDGDNLIKKNSMEYSILIYFRFYSAITVLNSLFITFNSLLLLLKKSQPDSLRVCKHCGNEIRPEYKYCGFCRTKIDSNEKQESKK